LVVGDVRKGGTVPGANRLAVLRHAKATHEFGFSDINRPLTKRGRRDAAAVGRFLRAQRIVPDLVLCSSSTRTRQTWQCLVASAAGVGDADEAAGGEVSYDPRVYDAGMEDLFELIKETPAEVCTLMIIGHNPAAHDLVLALTGDRDIEFPTCALAVIDMPEAWRQMPAAGGRLALLWAPKGAAG
jgi:phosphohistidine phosphatase